MRLPNLSVSAAPLPAVLMARSLGSALPPWRYRWRKAAEPSVVEATLLEAAMREPASLCRLALPASCV